jgi:hypothetical protein
LAASAGCPGGPARVRPPTIDAAAAGAKAIEMFDANKDGKLSGKELDKCPGLKDALPRVDPSGKGAVTADMIAARIRVWQELKVGRLTAGCRVLRRGQPLSGAEVNFVPEKFLGESIQTATGTTNASGSVGLGVSGQPGVPPGFYRVEITKAGLNIPAKYNTETILGQEIAPDIQHNSFQGNITFDLEF